MPLLQTLKCKFGRHNWSDWTFLEGGKEGCKQQRQCANCQLKENRARPHAWGEWEYVGDSCDQRRVCSQCKAREAREQLHTWGEWEYLDAGELCRVCGRCQVETRTNSERLGQMVSCCFSINELRDLCLELGVEYEDLPGEGRTDKATGLVKHFSTQQLNQLVQVCSRLRPQAPWEAPGMAKYEPYSSDSLAELSNTIAMLFSVEELVTLAFDIGSGHANLIEVVKEGGARELVLYFARRERVDELVACCSRQRPHATWPML